MLTEKQIAKFVKIYNHWSTQVNDARVLSSDLIRKLTRVEVALILTCVVEWKDKAVFTNKVEMFEFENFIVDALNGWGL